MRAPLATLRRVLPVIFLAGASTAMFGASSTWRGNASAGDWNAATNWTASGQPASTATADFAANGSFAPNINVNATIGELIFSGSYTQTFTGTSTLTIGGATGIDNTGTHTVAFSNPFALGGSSVWESTSTGGLTFNSAATIATAGHQLTADANSGEITFGGVISGTGSLVTTGSGTTELTAANTYSGNTNVDAGTLTITNGSALGTSGTVNVEAGATLMTTMSLSGTSVKGAQNDLVLNSNGSTPVAVLSNTGAMSAWEGNITLQGNAKISSGASDLLYIGSLVNSNTLSIGTNSLTFAPTASGVTPAYENPGHLDATNVLVNSTITGTGSLIVNGTGTVTIYPATSNSFSGSTTVNEGTLILDGNLNQPVLNSSSIVVGSATPVGTAVLQMGELNGSAPRPNNSQLGTTNGSTYSSNVNLTVYSNGLFNLNQSDQGLNSLTLQGGTVTGGSAEYTPTLSIANGITTNASSQTADITFTPYAGENGVLLMAASNFTFNIAKQTSGSGVDLNVDAQIQNGVGYTQNSSADGLIKTGAGKLVFTNANSYGGVTDIQNGILNIQNGEALGASSGSVSGTATANGTVVESGAQLQLQNGISVGDETLTLYGDGVSTDYSLQNVSGNNTWDGFINLSTTGVNPNTQISAASGTLNIATTGEIGTQFINGTTTGQNLTFGGAGNIIVNGGIGNNVGNVTQSGTGTVTLQGVNSYNGATTVDAGGTVQVTNNDGLSTHGTGVTVQSGATLQFAETPSSAGIASVSGGNATITGTGTANNGAIENVSGANSYAGNVTLGTGGARINADSGSTLTLDGNILGTAQPLTVGGAGNTNFAGAIQTGSSGTLTKDGTGTATLLGANTYGGLTSVSNGVLALGATGVLGASNVVNVSALGTLTTNALGVVSNTGGAYGTLSVGNFSNTISMLTGTGLVSFGTNAASSQLTLEGTGTFSGAFNGTGTLVVAAGSNFTLGANFDDPNLNIVLEGGTLNVLGTNSIFGTLDVTASSTLNFSPTLTSVIEFTGTASPSGGGVNIAGGATLSVTNWVSTIDYFDSTVEPGAGRNNAPLDQIVFDAPTWAGSNTTWNTYADGPGGDPDNEIVPIPEPGFYGAIVVALALGLSLLWAARRKSAKSYSA